ncbi:hypothetical protein BBJ28_00003940 [Nothophytophthora sp. Chile5]|nr:hypothetical protein BBJ28_00003940 [Nothophytophthora sp. Chile5]
MARPIRVLCLHGWRTSAQILRRQTEALRGAFGSRAEFLYIDAPFAASGPAPELVRSFYGQDGPYFQWWDAVKVQRAGDERASYRYEGFEHSLDYLTGQVQALGPIDALLGFSQGAAVTTLFTAHYRATYGHVPWKACVLVSGFYPRSVETRELLELGASGVAGGIDVPSVHVVGEADDLAPQSEKLFRSFAPQRRVRFDHEEGHKFPSPLKYAQLYHQIADEVLSMTSLVAQARF